MKILLAMIGVIVLSACATQQAVVKTKAQEVSDDFARGSLAAPCAMTYGAFTRLAAKDKVAVEILCGGSFLEKLIDKPTIAPDDLK